MPNLNVPLPDDLYTQMRVYKAKLGPNVTWQQYFWITSQDPEGDVDIEILSVNGKKPSEVIAEEILRLGDFVYKYNPKDKRMPFTLMKAIKHRIARKP